ncbi:malto-oligosyltrehalose synthase [[Mycobacterium] nativiensis]|uniref:Malto-oligosyltrehalose synthase n=1 Tax=[Mycobacterium] nativiensis TaxID=2855503 RepID=A0ABU5XS29_9MYCO|nr:malto-oligosyltrehalose synthase [Mycolicibacter sp. MYC340]MEB3030753.1 malto-oligosyltrehalose synthase [Mycolicibacter sp. MYC340]
MPSPVSTYRLQLRGPASGFGFTFADAEHLLDYLDPLGISHLYLSPILTAVHGSSHGYDVTDPTAVSAELGGSEGLRRLSRSARSRGMGLIADIVPNHAGVEVPEQNPWWWDVLRHGPASDFARFFDIDWDLGAGKIVLPVLDSEVDLAGLTIDGDRLRLGSLALPISPGTGAGSPADVYRRQHYRLVSWRSGQCGYRRFLAINSLAALRQEDEQVFAATHREVARWFDEGLVDGVRVDHLDGLSDPVGYLRRLRDLIGPRAWIVVEKNLAVDEDLEPTLPVAGTTGYDMLRLIGGVFVDPAGAPALTALAGPAAVDPVADLRAQAAAALDNDLQRLRRCITAATDADSPRLAEALAAVIGRVGVYRCDYPVTEPVLRTALAETASATPDLAVELAIISAAVAGGGRAAVAGGGRAAVRLQQLCVAAAAGGVEGLLFHRDARLVSLNEFGGDPHRFGCSTAEFHTALAERVRRWPQAMTTLSTHDTLRGEDVRARIGVLSQVPGWWAGSVARWKSANPCPDLATGLFLWQNIFGVWPTDGIVTASLRTRLHGYARKALREAARHSSWQHPDIAFEKAIAGWLDAVLDGPIADEVTALVDTLRPYAESDALGQKLLSLTVPGVPDVYQGTELFEDSLTDPDNRRPVDFAARRAELTAPAHPKMRVVHAALRLRRDRPETFLRGDYRPLSADGTAADHVVAFQRGDDVAVAVTRFAVRLAETGWGDTVLALPDGEWTDRLTGRCWSGAAPAAEFFDGLPVVLLERTGDTL